MTDQWTTLAHSAGPGAPRSQADLDFILARVIRHWVTDRQPPPDACKRGHMDWRPMPNGYRRCGTCAREQKRRKGRG